MIKNKKLYLLIVSILTVLLLSACSISIKKKEPEENKKDIIEIGNDNEKDTEEDNKDKEIAELKKELSELEGKLDNQKTDNTDEQNKSGKSDNKETVKSESKSKTTSNDQYGAINGIPLILGSNIFEGTFGTDGWYVDYGDSSDRYIFCPYSNKSYEYANLYLYHKDTSVDGDYCTEEEILKNGFYGYSIDVASSRRKPDMTWNGLTFGATFMDIKAEYGTPDYTYNGDMYTQLDYEIGNDYKLSFYVYNPGQDNLDEGLQKVELFNY